MTTSLETLCRQVEQESAAATEGKWTIRVVGDQGGIFICPPNAEDEESAICELPGTFFDKHANCIANATFIATARDFAPKASRALPEAAELLKVAKCPNCDGSGAFMVPHRNTGEADLQQCEWCDRKNQFLAQFEQPKENA